MKSKVISNFKTKENFKCYIRENEFSSEIKDSIFFNKFKCGYIIIPTTNANFINIYNMLIKMNFVNIDFFDLLTI